VMVLLCVFPTRNVVNFLISFTFFTVTHFSKVRCSRFVLKVPLNTNQSDRVVCGMLGGPFLGFTVETCCKVISTVQQRALLLLITIKLIMLNNRVTFSLIVTF